MSEVAHKVQDDVSGRQGSTVAKDRQMVIGSWRRLIKVELAMLLSRLPGALGLLQRSQIWPLIPGQVGRGVEFGANVSLRYPHIIRVGDGTIIDDNILLDAKGTTNHDITTGRDAFVGRNSVLRCKNGDIEIGDRANLGSRCELCSGATVRLGSDVLISAYGYLVGGRNYGLSATERPINQTLEGRPGKGVRTTDNVRVGTHAVVLDGVNVGEGSVVAAGGVVNHDIAPSHIVASVPAKVVGVRRTAATESV